jgi:hypothetical protein
MTNLDQIINDLNNETVESGIEKLASIYNDLSEEEKKYISKKIAGNYNAQLFDSGLEIGSSIKSIEDNLQ